MFTSQLISYPCGLGLTANRALVASVLPILLGIFGSTNGNIHAMTGIDYGNKRVEAGELVSDLPTKSVAWLLEQGLIVLSDEKVVAPAPAKEATKEKK